MNKKFLINRAIDSLFILLLTTFFVWIGVIQKYEPLLDTPLVRLDQGNTIYKIEKVNYLDKETFFISQFLKSENGLENLIGKVRVEGACFDLNEATGKTGIPKGYFTNNKGYHAYYLTEFNEE